MCDDHASEKLVPTCPHCEGHDLYLRIGGRNSGRVECGDCREIFPFGDAYLSAPDADSDMFPERTAEGNEAEYARAVNEAAERWADRVSEVTLADWQADFRDAHPT